MLKKVFFCLFTAVLCGSSLYAAPGKIIEIRKKASLNPSVYFAGDAVSPAVAASMRTFLGVCGWFEPVNSPEKADYSVIAENAPGSTVIIRLIQGKSQIAAWRFRSGIAPRELAKSAVDAIIERAFEQLEVSGFCRSRIAFGVETAPGVRNIFICDIDGGNVEQLTRYRTLNVEPCWSANAKSIFFSKYNSSGIDVIETTVASPRRSRLISAARGLNTGAAVSPDGSELALIMSFDRKVDLYILGLTKRFRRRLTSGIAVEASPCWSPDGKKLAFVSDRTGSPRIYVCNRDGSQLQRLPTIGADAVTPAWSKNNKIAYATRLNGAYTIAVYDMKTGENRQIITAPGNWESPEWAADNRQIVCKRGSGSDSALFVVDTKTGNQRILLKTGSRLFDPAWSPCQKRFTAAGRN